ncbi:hypothetical protein P3342_009848 [Pyrenophora teres f. teres]|nr:hypothetical protein P3342_009848 [Pyrenophora teres f. teres]
MRSNEIIAASVIPLVFFLAAMALVTRFLQSSTPPITDGKTERQVQLSHISTAWKRLINPKTDVNKIYWVPSLSGIIKAGDEGLFSSALFASLQGTLDQYHSRPCTMHSPTNFEPNELRTLET